MEAGFWQELNIERKRLTGKNWNPTRAVVTARDAQGRKREGRSGKGAGRGGREREEEKERGRERNHPFLPSCDILRIVGITLYYNYLFLYFHCLSYFQFFPAKSLTGKQYKES